jgi:hypothetical protein
VSYVNQSMIFDALHKKDHCIGPGLCIMLEVNFAFWAFSEVRIAPVLFDRMRLWGVCVLGMR